MFPAIERILAKNKLFQAWKDNSIFEALLASPPILVQEFSEEWIEAFKKLVGDGPMTYRSLINLADYIEKVRALDGYSHIKERMLRLDDQLYPTIAEVEFIWSLLLKTPPDKIHLEYTFPSPSGKNLELMVDHPSGPIYFEVTSIQEYREMTNILNYFNAFAAFQTSLKVLYGLNCGMVISFSEYPTQEMFKHIYTKINEYAVKGQYVFSVKEAEYTLEMVEGDNVVFNLPVSYLEKKIKDKIEEKEPKFREGDRNFIVIDVTPMVDDINVQLEKIGQYFQYTEDKKIWGVLLQFKRWTFEELEPVYKFGLIGRGNSKIYGKEPYNLMHDFIPDKI
jgi:hypothetical protein